MSNRRNRSDPGGAEKFLDRFREVYKLVVAAPLGSEWLPGSEVLIVGHGVTQRSLRGRPAQLSNGMYLNVQMTLQVTHESAHPPHIRLVTERATYTYQAGKDLNEPMPIFSYQYDRNPPSPYPRCHLHVHGTPKHHRGPSFPRLHLPTRRITLEQVIWHLIQEHGVQPRRDDWHQVLWRHEEWFRDIQKNRDWPYDRPFDRFGDGPEVG